MNYLSCQITFREIPDEVCLSILVTGCPLRCVDCNSKDSWRQDNGFVLNETTFVEILQKKQNWITCVLFLGGEWNKKELIQFLEITKSKKLKTALFTGLTEVDQDLKNHLDFLKTGPYIKSLGGLESPKTNQKLIHIQTGKKINHFKEEFIDQIK